MMQVGLFGKLFLIFPVFVFVPGFIAQRTLMADDGELDFFELMFLRVFLSLIVTTFSGLFLGLSGFYSLQNLIVQNLLIAFFCMVLSRFRFKSVKVQRKLLCWENGVLAGILLLAYAFCFRPFESVFGGSMPGTLIAAGGALKSTGSFFSFSQSFPELMLKGTEGLIISAGDALRTDITGMRILPGAVVWFAVFQELFGPAGVLFVSPAFAVAGVFFLFIFGKWLFRNSIIGLIAAALLAVNIAHFWFARMPSAAPVTQCMLLGGCAAFTRGSYGKKAKWLWVAVIAFAAAVFVQASAIPVAVTFAAGLVIYGVGEKKSRWIQTLFIVFATAVVLYLLLPHESSLYAFSFYAVCFPALLVFWAGFSRIRNAYFFPGFLLLAIGLGFWIRPETSAVPALLPLHWVLTAAGVFLAFAGLAWKLTDEETERFGWIWGAVAVNCTVFAIVFGRRFFPAGLEGFVPLSLPLMIVFAVYLLYRWAESKRDVLSWICVVLVLLIIAGFPLWKNREIILYRDYRGTMGFCSDLSKEFASWETVVCDRKELAVPLGFLFGRNVLFVDWKGRLSPGGTAGVLKRWGREGWAAYFVSTGSVSFPDQETYLKSTAINSYTTSVLNRSVNRIPGVFKKKKVSARISKII